MTADLFKDPLEFRANLLIALAFVWALGLVFLFKFLYAMLYREAVKQDLAKRFCRPKHIRWQIFAWWASCPRRIFCPAFRVVYVNLMDNTVHQARCYVRPGNDFQRNVIWVDDENFMDI